MQQKAKTLALYSRGFLKKLPIAKLRQRQLSKVQMKYKLHTCPKTLSLLLFSFASILSSAAWAETPPLSFSSLRSKCGPQIFETDTECSKDEKSKYLELIKRLENCNPIPPSAKLSDFQAIFPKIKKIKPETELVAVPLDGGMEPSANKEKLLTTGYLIPEGRILLFLKAKSQSQINEKTQVKIFDLELKDLFRWSNLSNPGTPEEDIFLSRKGDFDFGNFFKFASATLGEESNQKFKQSILYLLAASSEIGVKEIEDLEKIYSGSYQLDSSSQACFQLGVDNLESIKRSLNFYNAKQEQNPSIGQKMKAEKQATHREDLSTMNVSAIELMLLECKAWPTPKDCIGDKPREAIKILAERGKSKDFLESLVRAGHLTTSFSKQAIVQALGTPPRVKKTRDGGEVWRYDFSSKVGSSGYTNIVFNRDGNISQMNSSAVTLSKKEAAKIRGKDISEPELAKFSDSELLNILETNTSEIMLKKRGDLKSYQNSYSRSTLKNVISLVYERNLMSSEPVQRAFSANINDFVNGQSRDMVVSLLGEPYCVDRFAKKNGEIKEWFHQPQKKDSPKPKSIRVTFKGDPLKAIGYNSPAGPCPN